MPIQFRCEHCSNLIRTPDGTAGKRAECPYCGEVMSIPASSNKPASVDKPAQSPEQATKPQGSPSDAQRVEFPCPKCTRPVRTLASAVGKRGKCPSCGAVIQIPQRTKQPPTRQVKPAEAGVSARQHERATTKPASIEFDCPSCGKTIRTPAAAAGKKGRCPKCGEVMQIPSGSKAKTAGRGQPASRRSKPRGATSAGAASGLEPIPGLTPVSTPGLTTLPDAVPGLTPLADSDSGLTPLSDADAGLTPLPADDGLTPLSDSGGLTPLGPAQPADDLFSSDISAPNPFAGDHGGGMPIPSSNPYQAPAYARRRTGTPSRGVVMAPAIAMMVVIGLNLLFSVPYLILNTIRVVGLENQANQGPGGAASVVPYAVGAILGAVLCLGVYVLMFVGAYRMMRFQSWGLALTSAILMLFPCTFCWIGLPFGIWAIIVLSLQSTRDQFS